MIDINKKYQTRNGCEARIYRTDGGGLYPVHGAIKQFHAIWEVCMWTSSGQVNLCFEGAKDLIEVLPRIKGWVNLYHESFGLVYSSREDADQIGIPGRVACIEINVEHGHGLEGT